MIERLPWLLNGSLEDAERAAVVDHLRRCAGCRNELAETLGVCRIFDQHPASTELVDVAFGQPVEDRAGIDRHLLVCDRCAEQLALLRQSRALESERVVPFAPPPRAPGVSRHWRSAAIAAALVAVLGVGDWLRGERVPRVIVTPAPQVAAGGADELAADLAVRGTRFETLVPESIRRRSARLPGEKVFTLRPRGDLLVVELQQADLEASYPFYVVRLAGPDGEILERSFDRAFEIVLPLAVELLANGEHVIELYGSDGETREPIDRYSFSVELAADETPPIP